MEYDNIRETGSATYLVQELTALLSTHSLPFRIVPRIVNGGKLMTLGLEFRHDYESDVSNQVP